jgi:hypothetical protein
MDASKAQRRQNSSWWSDRQTHCEHVLPLLCQQELYTQGILDVHAVRNHEDSNLAIIEVIQSALFDLLINHSTYYEQISRHSQKFGSTTYSIFSAVTHKLNVTWHMIIAFLCGIDVQNMSAHVSQNCVCIWYWKANSLCGVVVRVHGYRSKGPGFDYLRKCIFWE